MRINNSLKNIYTGLFGQVITLLVTFVTRTIFIKILGVEYLGISGLFSNILTIFSLAELGVGQAIIFSLYKAIADDDKQKICGLMNLYEKIYKCIGIFILIIGIGLTPFLGKIIGQDVNIQNINLIYILFVMNSAASYFYIYRSSFIIANQKNYIITKINYMFLIITNMLQIVLLFITRNYIIYLLTQITLTIIQNMYISYKCVKLYPFLKESNKYKLYQEEKKDIFKNIRSLMIYKIGTISLNSTDNLIISYFVGIITVGLYSNYNLIIISISGVLSTIFSSLTASIGNLVAKENIDKKEFIFNVVYFASFWMYGVCSICLFILLTPFIKIWIGEQFILNNYTVFVIVLNFYIGGILFAPYVYRQTLGLFIYGKWRPIISAFLNIVISILLAQKLGLVGVLLGTLITRVSTNGWFDPYIVYSKGFKMSVKGYFKKYIQYLLVIILCGFISYYICSLVSVSGIIGLITKGIVCFAVSNILLLIIYFNTDEFNYIFNIFKQIISEKISGFRVNYKGERNSNEEI